MYYQKLKKKADYFIYSLYYLDILRLIKTLFL